MNLSQFKVIFLLFSIFFFSCETNTHKIEEKTKNSPFNETKIGSQIWMIENLNVTSFRNGDSIQEVKTSEEWVKLTLKGIPVWSYYNNDEKNGVEYGKLYNWYVFTDERGLGPEGWDIPNEDDFDELLKFTKGEGEVLKSRNLWLNTKGFSGNGSNGSGFNGKPGGFRDKNGSFYLISRVGQWWVKPKVNSDSSKYFMLQHFNGDVSIKENEKLFGRSIRLIKK